MRTSRHSTRVADVEPAARHHVEHAVGVRRRQSVSRPVDGSRTGAVPRRVDEHEPRLVVVVGPQRRVVGGADVDGRVVDRPGVPAEHRVELGVVVVREEHGVVREVRGPAAQREQQHEARQRRGRPAEPAAGRAGDLAGEQVVVQVPGVGVRDDHVGRDHLAVAQPYARHPARVQRDRRDRGVRPDRRRRAAVPARAPPHRARGGRRATYHAPNVCSTYGTTASAAGARRGSEPV